MQQPVSEEGAVYEPPSVRSYDDLFPALPEFTPAGVNTNSAMGLWNNNTMRVGSSTVTQVFRLDLKFLHLVVIFLNFNRYSISSTLSI